MAVLHEQELTQALDNIESRFYMSGTVKRGVRLIAGFRTYDFPMSQADAAAKLPRLVAAAHPSAFGKGSETLHDPTVRVAKELPAEHFHVNFSPQAEGILEKVRKALVPDAAAVVAEQYKLNIMTAGGFFKAHQDTPRGDATTCFGTLVVALPVHFKGGELTLNHGRSSAKFEWDKVGQPEPWTEDYHDNLDGHYTPQQLQEAERQGNNHVPEDAGLQWAAFFGDVKHEVLTVTEGHRITVTYTLHRSSAPNPNADVLLARAGNFSAKLKEALADPEWMTGRGGAIGFRCRHLYEESALAQAEARLASGYSAAYAAKLRLKNEDAVIASVLTTLGLRVKCVRLLQMNYNAQEYAVRKMLAKEDAARFGRRIRIEGSYVDRACTDDTIANFGARDIADVVGHDIVWIGSHKAANKEWVDGEYSATDYFGNEGANIMFYTAAALVAVIPPPAERGSLIAAAEGTTLTSEVISHAAQPAAGGSSSHRSGRAAAADHDCDDSDHLQEDEGDTGYEDSMLPETDSGDAGSSDGEDYLPDSNSNGMYSDEYGTDYDDEDFPMWAQTDSGGSHSQGYDEYVTDSDSDVPYSALRYGASCIKEQDEEMAPESSSDSDDDDDVESTSSDEDGRVYHKWPATDTEEYNIEAAEMEDESFSSDPDTSEEESFSSDPDTSEEESAEETDSQPEACSPVPINTETTADPTVAAATAGGTSSTSAARAAAATDAAALREIRHYQATVHNLLSEQAFERLVREVLQDEAASMGITRRAVKAMQVAAEDHLINMFKAANLFVINAGHQKHYEQREPLAQRILSECSANAH